MTDREKQTADLQNILIDNGIFNNLVCRQDYAYPDALINDLCFETAQVVINNGYRKMDEVTLRLDLGDRTAEEIKQIAEEFNKAMATDQTLGVVEMDDGLRLSLESEKEKEQIIKKTLKDVLDFLWGWNNGSLDRVIDAFVQQFGVEIDE